MSPEQLADIWARRADDPDVMALQAHLVELTAAEPAKRESAWLLETTTTCAKFLREACGGATSEATAILTAAVVAGRRR